MSTEWKMVPVKMTLEMSVAFAESFYSKRRAMDDHDMSDWWSAVLAASPQPAAQPEQPESGGLTDAGIIAIATAAVAAGELSWLGFEKDENDEYRIPSLAPCHFQLVRAVLSTTRKRSDAEVERIMADFRSALDSTDASVDEWRVNEAAVAAVARVERLLRGAA